MSHSQGNIRILMAQGVLNIPYPVKKVNCVETIKNLTTNIPFEIKKNADSSWLHVILIPKQHNLDSLLNLEIKFNDGMIWKIPFKIIKYMAEIKQTKTHYMITLPTNLFFENELNNFPIVATQHCKLMANITSKQNISYSVMLNKSYLETEEHQDLAKIEHDYKIKQYISSDFSESDTLHISLSLVCSGFFIETDKEIESIKLSVDNEIVFEYDKNAIECVGEILHEWTDEHKNMLYRLNLPTEVIYYGIEKYVKNYMYWIPFDPCKKWNDKFDTLINFGRFDSAKIELDKKCNGTIHFIEHNLLRIMGGLVGCVYGKSQNRPSR